MIQLFDSVIFFTKRAKGGKGYLENGSEFQITLQKVFANVQSQIKMTIEFCFVILFNLRVLYGFYNIQY